MIEIRLMPQHIPAIPPIPEMNAFPYNRRTEETPQHVDRTKTSKQIEIRKYKALPRSSTRNIAH